MRGQPPPIGRLAAPQVAPLPPGGRREALMGAGRDRWLPYITKNRQWNAILNRVLGRPVVSVILAGGLLVALSIPEPDPRGGRRAACRRTARSHTGSRARRAS